MSHKIWKTKSSLKQYEIYVNLFNMREGYNRDNIIFFNIEEKGQNIPHNQLFARKIKIKHCLMHWTIVKTLHPGNYSRVDETDLSIMW